MTEEKDLLTIWKERIEAEKMHKDYSDACRDAKVSATTYQNAFKKTDFKELTKREIEFYKALMEIFDKRKEEKQKLLQQYANN